MIVGVDQMAFFASYLRHLLALLDIRAEVVASPRQDSITRLGRVDEDTLVIAFSAGRAHPLVVRAMKLARHRRARTLSISDATLSEVGEHAELTLYYSSNSPSFTRSNAALLAVVQALAHGVYARDKARVQGPHPRLQAEVTALGASDSRSLGSPTWPGPPASELPRCPILGHGRAGHIPGQARPRRDAQGRGDHGRDHRRAGSDRRGGRARSR